MMVCTTYSCVISYKKLPTLTNNCERSAGLILSNNPVHYPISSSTSVHSTMAVINTVNRQRPNLRVDLKLGGALSKGMSSLIHW